MATYSSSENMTYGTYAEMLADKETVKIKGAKWYCTDMGQKLVSDGTYWRLPGEGNPNIERYGILKEVR